MAHADGSTLEVDIARWPPVFGALDEKAEVPSRERDFFIDNLLVRIHLIIEIILVDRPCAMGV